MERERERQTNKTKEKMDFGRIVAFGLLSCVGKFNDF
jgi:hypothetical protein